MALAGAAADPRHFVIHGKGEVGGKYEQLILKYPMYMDAGFGRLKAHILSKEYVWAYLKRCGAEKAILNQDFDGARKLILDGAFSAGEMKAIVQACRDLGVYPALAIRNSAAGDAMGTGMLGDSKFLFNNAENAAQGVKEDIASYFTRESFAFRQDACLAEGLAVGIEPLVAHEWKDVRHLERTDGKEGRPHFMEIFGNAYAPDIGGIGRTYSYAMRGEYLGVVKGLAADYVKDPRYGFIVRKSDLGSMDCKHHLKCAASREHHMNSFRQSSLVLDKDGQLSHKDLPGARHEIIMDYAFDDLLQKVARLAANCSGVPQYFEFASILESREKREHFMVQIADDAISNFTFSKSEDRSRVCASGEYVQVGGHAKATHILEIRQSRISGHNGAQWMDIEQASGEGCKYILVFDSRSAEQNTMHFEYWEFQNVRGIVEFGDASGYGLHTLGPHLGGTFALVKTPMAAVARENYNHALVRASAKCQTMKFGAKLYEVPAELFASEKEQCAELVIGNANV